jgi:hypothetical protein
MNNIELARNPNTPVKTLELLAIDENSDVRCGVAYNPNTPPETLELLATDKDSVIRSWVVYNPNATEEVCLMVKAYEKYGHLVNCHNSST